MKAGWYFKGWRGQWLRLAWSPSLSTYIQNKHNTFNQCWCNFGPRLRRWPNMKPELCQRLAFAGILTQLTIWTSIVLDLDITTPLCMLMSSRNWFRNSSRVRKLSFSWLVIAGSEPNRKKIITIYNNNEYSTTCSIDLEWTWYETISLVRIYSGCKIQEDLLIIWCSPYIMSNIHLLKVGSDVLHLPNAHIT